MDDLVSSSWDGVREVHGDGGALGGKLLGNRLAEAAAAAGDDGYLACEVCWHVRDPFVWGANLFVRCAGDIVGDTGVWGKPSPAGFRPYLLAVRWEDPAGSRGP